MYGVILLLVVAMLSLLLTRIATIALTATGMSQPSARFQARSALTGVGFTTTESEAVVAHPARRRIIMALMLPGQRRTGHQHRRHPGRGGRQSERR